MWSLVWKHMRKISMKSSDIKSFDDFTLEFKKELGNWSWSGAETVVWDLGHYVLKLATIEPKLFPDMRRLIRSKGSPIIPVLDLRVVGQIDIVERAWRADRFKGEWRNDIRLVIMILQEKVVSLGEMDEKDKNGFPTWPDEEKARWMDDEGQLWEQRDPHPWNISSDGRWFDLGAIVRCGEELFVIKAEAEV